MVEESNVQGEEVQAEAQQEVQVETETTPQTVEELQAKLAQVESDSKQKLAQLEENLKNESRAKSKRETENQQLRERLDSNASQEDMLKALIAVVANQQNKSSDVFEEEVKSQQPDLMKQFDEIQAEGNSKLLKKG